MISVSEQLLTVAQAAELARVPIKTIEELIETDRLTHIELEDGQIRLPQRAFLQTLSALTAEEGAHRPRMWVRNSDEGIPMLLNLAATHDVVRPATATEIELADRAADLEDALYEAVATIDFLHLCLIGKADYAYPDQTLSELDRLNQLLVSRERCHHGRSMPGCPGCQARDLRFRLQAERETRAKARRDAEQTPSERD